MKRSLPGHLGTIVRAFFAINLQCVNLRIMNKLTNSTLPLALVVVYDYHPNALTLAELHFYQQGSRANGSSTSNSSGFSRGSQNYNQPGSGIGAGVGAGAGGGAAGRLERIPEQTLWSYIFQIASAIRAVHEAGFAVRMVDASKILWTGQNR